MTRMTALLSALLAVLLVSATAEAKTIHVHKGQSIQAAVDRAKKGDRIVVAPGTYREDGQSCPAASSQTCAVAIQKDGIKLVGIRRKKHPVVLQARKGQDAGVEVAREHQGGDCLSDASQRIHGSVVSGITVRGFHDFGVFLLCVDHWRITHVRAIDNGEYGTFPSHTVSGRLDHSFASGANDTGHYIGQSRRARVDHNVAKHNVSGFELENSSRIRADHNLASANTGGILSFALPNLDVKTNTDNRIDHNRVTGNNKRNTCVEPEDTVCDVPAGTGILMLAVDRNRVQANKVNGNRSYGIAVANYCVALGVSASDCAALDIDPNPDNNQVTGNTAKQNGKNPDPSVPSVFTVDLAWDLTGTGNCWADNKAGTTFPSPLPACP
jgi:parallel beta-helix repeat protein